jgi:hypothetical protein
MSKRSAHSAELEPRTCVRTTALATAAPRSHDELALNAATEDLHGFLWARHRDVVTCNHDVLSMVRAHLVTPAMVELMSPPVCGGWREFDLSAVRWSSWHLARMSAYACVLPSHDIVTLLPKNRPAAGWSVGVHRRISSLPPTITPFITVTKKDPLRPAVVALPGDAVLVLDKRMTAVVCDGVTSEECTARFPYGCSAVAAWNRRNSSVVACATADLYTPPMYTDRARGAIPLRWDPTAAVWHTTSELPARCLSFGMATFGTDDVAATAVRISDGAPMMFACDCREDRWRELASPSFVCDNEQRQFLALDADELLHYHADACSAYSLRANRWTRRPSWDVVLRTSRIISGYVNV